MSMLSPSNWLGLVLLGALLLAACGPGERLSYPKKKKCDCAAYR